jgi:hypothetical protein
MMKLALLCLMLCAPSALGDDPPPPPAPSPAPPPVVPAHFILQMSAGNRPALWAERAKLEAVIAAIKARDGRKLVAIYDSVGVMELPGGMHVTATDSIPGGRLVRVDHGAFVGRTGWIEERFLRAAVAKPVEAKPAVAAERATAERAKEIERRKARRAEMANYVPEPMPPLYFSPATSGAIGGGSSPLPGMATFSSLCGAMTQQNRPCQNRVAGGGFCYLHR